MLVKEVRALANIVVFLSTMNPAASLSDQLFHLSLSDFRDPPSRTYFKRELPTLIPKTNPTTTTPAATTKMKVETTTTGMKVQPTTTGMNVQPTTTGMKIETTTGMKVETTTTTGTHTTLHHIETATKKFDGMTAQSGNKDTSVIAAMADKMKFHDFHGSDEMKVFFRDCEPYMKDTMFGGPVCASDTITYPNFMYMECKNYRKLPQNRVKVEYEGPCWSNPGPGLCSTEPIYDPVCGSDNRTYVNTKALKCVLNSNHSKEVTVKHAGPCMDRSPCFIDNYTWNNPVCVTSARTLQSYQAVQCLRSLQNDLTIIHDGHCNAEDLTRAYVNRSLICQHLTKEVEPFPVCGSDRQTYPSAAFVLCKKPHLKILFDGPCNSTVYEACEKVKFLEKNETCTPVCGSDGITYKSEHHLHCATHNRKHLKRLHDGPCEAKDSPCIRLFQSTDYHPVCSSDGVTYISILAMECIARYSKQHVQVKHMGPCLKTY